MGKMVPATEFKAKCLALIAEMESTGEPLTVTRRGKPPITLKAERSKPPKIDDIFGCMRGTGRIVGDIEGPIDPDWEAKWEAKWDERGFPASGTTER